MQHNPKDYDTELNLKRQHDPNRFVDKMENCTFKPEIYYKGGNTRCIKDLYEWEMARKDKITTQRLSKQLNVPQHAFKPKLSSRSIKMAEKTRDSHTPLHERLMKTALDKERKLKMMRNNEKQKMFKPTLNNKSRAIVDKKVQRKSKRVENGQTDNLDFYKAVPDFPRALSPKQKTYNHKKKEKWSRSARTKVILTTPKKSDPHPSYASPYNRGILSAGIPLKTLIEKSEKHRAKLQKRARKKTARGEPIPGRGVSRSKSKRSIRVASKSPSTKPFMYGQSKARRSTHNMGTKTKARASSRASSKGSNNRSKSRRGKKSSVRRPSTSQYAQDEIFFESLRGNKSSKGSRQSGFVF